MDADDVYYRIDKGGNIRTMQWFDEFNYDASQFMTDERFATEQEAADYIARNNDLLTIFKWFKRAGRIPKDAYNLDQYRDQLIEDAIKTTANNIRWLKYDTEKQP